MKIEVDSETRNRARFPHDLYLLNMFLFNLPAVAGTLAFTIGHAPWLEWGIAAALTLSLAIIGYAHWRAQRAMAGEHWFVMAHWWLSVKRSHLLLIGYGLMLLIIGAGLLIGSGMRDHNMQTIMATVFTRIGVMPALILILVTAILEGQAMHLVNNGIVPGHLAKRLPPPQGVRVLGDEETA
jgi:hypothetical protein